MCNFVIRPIKSYATVEVAETEAQEGNVLVERGDYIDVVSVSSDGVFGYVNGNEDNTVTIPLEVYIHTFTANPDDIEKVRKEEQKIMGYDPNKSKK